MNTPLSSRRFHDKEQAEDVARHLREFLNARVAVSVPDQWGWFDVLVYKKDLALANAFVHGWTAYRTNEFDKHNARMEAEAAAHAKEHGPTKTT